MLGGCRHKLRNPSPDTRSRSMTPEDRGRSPIMQERMCRWPIVNNLEQTRMIRPWGLLEKERKTVKEARDALLIEAGRGVNAMSRMMQRGEEVMTGLNFSYCAKCRREQFKPGMAGAHSAGSEPGYPAAQGSPRVGEKDKPVILKVRSRDEKVLEPEGLEAFYDRRITKLITMGGLRSHCYQLCTGENEAVWKQVAIPENGQQGIFVIPVTRTSNRVDRAPEWMSSSWPSAWPPEVANQERQPGVMEVVLNGATHGLDGGSGKSSF